MISALANSAFHFTNFHPDVQIAELWLLGLALTEETLVAFEYMGHLQHFSWWVAPRIKITFNNSFT